MSCAIEMLIVRYSSIVSSLLVAIKCVLLISLPPYLPTITYVPSQLIFSFIPEIEVKHDRMVIGEM